MDMRWTRWIWYAGTGAWLLSGLAAVHLHHILHAKIAFTLALMFLAAAYFFQTQGRRLK